MDSDDPEKRIADLERQLGEARTAGDPGANRGFQQGAFPPPPQAGLPPPPGGWQDPAQTPPVGSQRTANAGSKTRRGRKPMGIGRWLTAIFFVGLGLYFLSFSVRQFYGYQVGAPTTATGIHCRYGVPGSGGDLWTLADFTLSGGCTAAWSVGGQSQTGPIVGVQHLGSADVHVNGGTAFTAPFSSWFFGGHLLLAGLFVVFGLGQFWDVGRLWRWMKPAR